MSTSVSTSFVTAYSAKLQDLFQRQGSMLRPTVTRADNVVGSSHVFQTIGKGAATTKARHGTITPMNQTHAAPSATLEDFYAGDWSDKLDESKQSVNQQDALARGGAFALGRKVDDQIIVILNSTSESTSTLTTSTIGNARGGLLTLVKLLDANDVPNDGMRYGLLTPNMWAIAMAIPEFTSSDFVTAEGRPYITGAPGFRTFANWMGVKWGVHTALPGVGTTAANIYVYHSDSLGYATGASVNNMAAVDGVAADITWHGDRAAFFVNHMMSGGGALIDTTGIIEGLVVDTTAVPTS